MISSALSESGVLEIYPRESQNGTIARRIFTDEHNHPIREIYYHARYSSKKPKDETDLVAYQVRLYTYNADHRQEWMGEYSPELWMGWYPNLVLERSLETHYNSSGKVDTSQWRDADGIVRYQIRYEKGDSSHLYFDDTGEHLIGIRGMIPSDMNLSPFIGKPIDGLVCWTGVNRSQVNLKDFYFYVTVLNLSTSERKIIRQPPYWDVNVELKDASGHLVPQNVDYVTRRNKALSDRKHGVKDDIQTLSSHEADSGLYRLQDWYSNLPVGTYSLKIRRRADGNEFSLASKAVQLQVIKDQD